MLPSATLAFNCITASLLYGVFAKSFTAASIKHKTGRFFLPCKTSIWQCICSPESGKHANLCSIVAKIQQVFFCCSDRRRNRTCQRMYLPTHNQPTDKHFSFPGNRSDNLPAQGILSIQVLHYICNTFCPFKKAVLSLTGAFTCQRVSGMRGLFWTAVTSFIREYWWIFIVIVGPCRQHTLLQTLLRLQAFHPQA